MNKLANEIMKKDIRLLLRNKRLVSTICIPVVVFAVVTPIISVIATRSMNMDLNKYAAIFEKVFKVSMGDLTLDAKQRMVIELLLYNILPMLFMIIPTIMATVIPANSFVGEKANGTLETLFFAPIRTSDIFIAKVKVSLFMSMGLSVAVFVFMSIVLNIVLPLNGLPFFIPNVRWFVTLFVVCLAITILSTTLIIKKSESSSSIEEAQGVAAFVALPIAALIVAQVSGVILIGDAIFIVMSAVLLGASLMALKIVSTKVGYRR